MIRCAAAERRTYVAGYQISWLLLALDSRGRAEINYFWGETYSASLIKPRRGWTDWGGGEAGNESKGEYLVCEVRDDLCL